MGKKCPQCNTITKDDNKFCHSCGHAFEETPGTEKRADQEAVTTAIPPVITAPVPASPVNPPPGNRSKMWLMISLVTLLVIAIVAAVVIVVVVATDDGGKNGDTITTNEENENSHGENSNDGDTTTKPKPPVVVDLDKYIKSANASSQLQTDYRQSSYIDYGPSNLIDNDKASCWAEGVPGYGIGSWVQFDFKEPVVIKEVRAIPGYDKFSKIDRWVQNGKLHQVMLTFSDGTSQTITFEKKRDAQVIPLTKQVETTFVKITVLSVFEGEGPEPVDDTSVSEFHLRGYTAAAYEEYEQEL